MLTKTVSWVADSHCWDGLLDADALKIYSAYKRPLGIGSAPALLMIDLYNLVFEGGPRPPVELQSEFPASCGVFAHNAIEPIERTLAGAREVGIPVIHVAASPAKSSFNGTNRPGAIGIGDSWEFHPSAMPLEGELVIRKSRASSFYGTTLISELVHLGIDTVIVAGESTSGCVRAAVVDSYTNGFHTVVVEEAVFDRSWLNHQVNLFDMHHKYADVMRVDTALELIRETGE